MWGNCDDIGAPPPPGTAPAEPPERQSAPYIKRNQMGGTGDRAGASQQQRRILPRGDHRRADQGRGGELARKQRAREELKDSKKTIQETRNGALD